MADKKQTMLYGLLTSIASKITYDNTESGLEAENVQDAIDEVNSNLQHLKIVRDGDDIDLTSQVNISYSTTPIYDNILIMPKSGFLVINAAGKQGGWTNIDGLSFSQAYGNNISCGCSKLVFEGDTVNIATCNLHVCEYVKLIPIACSKS